jgi:hypothetical protein
MGCEGIISKRWLALLERRDARLAEDQTGRGEKASGRSDPRRLRVLQSLRR